MDYFFWDDGYGEFHKLWVWEDIVEVEVFNVGGEAFCIGGGDHTVEEALGCGDGGCWGAEGAVKGEIVSSHREAGAVLLRFLWFDVTVDFTICASFVCGHFCLGNEHNCVGPFDVPDALG